MTASSGTELFPGRHADGWYVPGDAVSAVLVAVLTDLLVVTPVSDTWWLTVPFGLTLLFFLPGYALLAALFPRRDREQSEEVALRSIHRSTLTLGERTALSVGLSVLVLPVVALALGAAGIALGRAQLATALALVVTAGMLVGTVRRWRLPESERFVLWADIQEFWSRYRRRLDSKGTVALATTLVLAGAVVLAVSTLGVALVVPHDESSYTQLSVLTQNESGAYVASGYPDEVTAGESVPLVLEVDNHEGQPVEYSIVVELQRVERTNTSVRVESERRLGTFDRTVGPDRTWRNPHTITPGVTGEDRRLTYLLYRGDPPAQPSQANAYRRVHIWMTVTAE